MAEARPAPRHPLPAPDDQVVEEFWGYCAKHELRFQRCTCGTWRHVPRLECAACGSGDWSWERSSGRGRVYSWTITHQAPQRFFADRVPYAVLVVELEEGVRMVAGLRGAQPEALELDLPVEVIFEDVGDSMALPHFKPRSKEALP